MHQFASYFSREEVERVHEASLEVLENTGMYVRNERAREIFAKGGCQVDNQTTLVKFPRKVVEECRKSFCTKIQIHCPGP